MTRNVSTNGSRSVPSDWMTADERNDYDKHLADLDQRIRAIGFVLSMVRAGLAQ